MNWVGFAGAAGALIALVVAMVRIVGLTKEKGELKLTLAGLETKLTAAEQGKADADDRSGRLTLIAENRQKVINELLAALRKSGKPGAAGLALDQLLQGPARPAADPEAPRPVPPPPPAGKPRDPA